MKKTALSKKELDVLSEVIAKHGNAVSFDELKSLLPAYSHAALIQLVGSLTGRGWFIRIKKGFYAVASLESHGFANISPLAVSQIIVPGSYVSFELALNYHGFFDQLPAAVKAVSPAQSKPRHFQGLEYRFVKAKSEMMTGFSEVLIDGQTAYVAELEKALLDFLYFRKDRYTVSLVLEKLRDAKDEIDMEKLFVFSRLYPIAMRRRLGYLLDLAGIDSDKLHAGLKGVPGFTKLTRNSNFFNAKWRVYYEERFAK